MRERMFVTYTSRRRLVAATPTAGGLGLVLALALSSGGAPLASGSATKAGTGTQSVGLVGGSTYRGKTSFRSGSKKKHKTITLALSADGKQIASLRISYALRCKRGKRNQRATDSLVDTPITADGHFTAARKFDQQPTNGVAGAKGRLVVRGAFAKTGRTAKGTERIRVTFSAPGKKSRVCKQKLTFRAKRVLQR